MSDELEKPQTPEEKQNTERAQLGLLLGIFVATGIGIILGTYAQSAAYGWGFGFLTAPFAVIAFVKWLKRKPKEGNTYEPD